MMGAETDPIPWDGEDEDEEEDEWFSVRYVVEQGPSGNLVYSKGRLVSCLSPLCPRFNLKAIKYHPIAVLCFDPTKYARFRPFQCHSK